MGGRKPLPTKIHHFQLVLESLNKITTRKSYRFWLLPLLYINRITNGKKEMLPTTYIKKMRIILFVMKKNNIAVILATSSTSHLFLQNKNVENHEKDNLTTQNRKDDEELIVHLFTSFSTRDTHLEQNHYEEHVDTCSSIALAKRKT